MSDWPTKPRKTLEQILLGTINALVPIENSEKKELAKEKKLASQVKKYLEEMLKSLK